MSKSQTAPRSDTRKTIVTIGDIIKDVVVYDDTLYRRNNENLQAHDLLTTLIVRALSYTPNPRNLEAHWKPMYSVWLTQMAYDHQKLDCFQEQPVWYTPYSKLPEDPNKSITAGQVNFVTLYPDLGIVKVGQRDEWLLICELKRSPKRGFIFNADLEYESDGWIDLREKVYLAISQVQRQAYIALHENNKQNEIILLAASGPFWTYVVASRKEINALYVKSEGPVSVAEALVEEKEEEDKAEDDQEQVKAKEVVKDDVTNLISNINMTRHHLFGWTKRISGLRNKSRTQKEDLNLVTLENRALHQVRSSLPWAKVMFVGTAASNVAMGTVREKIKDLANADGAKSTPE